MQQKGIPLVFRLAGEIHARTFDIHGVRMLYKKGTLLTPDGGESIAKIIEVRQEDHRYTVTWMQRSPYQVNCYYYTHAFLIANGWVKC